MLNILDAYDLDETKKLDEEAYHKIIESMKHAYALRTANGDPEFFPDEGLFFIYQKNQFKCIFKLEILKRNAAIQIT